MPQDGAGTGTGAEAGASIKQSLWDLRADFKSYKYIHDFGLGWCVGKTRARRKAGWKADTRIRTAAGHGFYVLGRRRQVAKSKTFNCIFGQVSFGLSLLSPLLLSWPPKSRSLAKFTASILLPGFSWTLAGLIKYVMCHKWQILRHTSLIPLAVSFLRRSLLNCCSICCQHTHTHTHANTRRHPGTHTHTHTDTQRELCVFEVCFW